MVAKTTPKRLTYWLAEFLREDLTLQEAVSNALKSKKSVGSRQTTLTSSSGPDNGKYFINKSQKYSGMLVGQFVLYEPGRFHQAIQIDEDKDALDLVEIAPKIGDAKAQAEFLESVLYFGIAENHIILLQSRSLRGREFESYLTWLLREAESLHEEDGMSLVRGLSAEAQDKIANGTPTKLSIGTDLFSGMSPVRASGDKKMKFRPTGPLWELLSVLTEGRLDKLKLSEGIDPETLRVLVEVRYKKRTDTQGAKIMDALTKSLRHLHEDDFRAQFPKTGELKGDRMFLSHLVGVLANAGNVIESDLYRRMHEWLTELVKRGIV